MLRLIHSLGPSSVTPISSLIYHYDSSPFHRSNSTFSPLTTPKRSRVDNKLVYQCLSKNSMNQTQTAVFTLLLHILLPGDHITKLQLIDYINHMVHILYCYMKETYTQIHDNTNYCDLCTVCIILIFILLHITVEIKVKCLSLIIQ